MPVSNITLGLFCYAGCSYGSQATQLGRIPGCLPPSEISMVLSYTMKLILREEAFKSVPSEGSLGPASEVHGVVSNSDIPSTPKGNQGQ